MRDLRSTAAGRAFGEGFAGVSGPEGKSGQPVFAPIPENRWGVFVTGLGEFTNVESTFNASGYDLATGGFTMGIDYRIGSNFAIGLTGGYAYTSADLVNDEQSRGKRRESLGSTPPRSAADSIWTPRSSGA